jgi:hypothetical protein
MNIGQEIARRVETLPAELQERVLRFVASLTASAQAGERGSGLRQFSSSLDSVKSPRRLTRSVSGLTPASGRFLREHIASCHWIYPGALAQSQSFAAWSMRSAHSVAST